MRVPGQPTVYRGCVLSFPHHGEGRLGHEEGAKACSSETAQQLWQWALRFQQTFASLGLQVFAVRGSAIKARM